MYTKRSSLYLLMALVMALTMAFGSTSVLAAEETGRAPSVLDTAELTQELSEPDLADESKVAGDDFETYIVADSAPIYPPISEITTSYAGSWVDFDNSDPDVGAYTFHMPGASMSDLSDVSVTLNVVYYTGIVMVDIGNDSQMLYYAPGTLTFNNVNLNTTTSIGIRWGESMMDIGPLVNCPIILDRSAASVDLSGVTIEGTSADYDVSTVGGVSRYLYKAILPSATPSSVLSNATVTISAISSNATIKLQVGDVTKGTGTGGLTVSGVDFTDGNVKVIVTDGSLQREYSLQALIDGAYITVEIGIRTYNVADAINGTGYYTTNDPGDWVNDLSAAEKQALLYEAESLSMSTPDGNRTFGDPSNPARATFYDYVEMEVPSDAVVMEVLRQFCDDYGITPDIGYGGNYLSSMTMTGTWLGEFDCGWMSGWMYTVESAGGNKWMPNYGAGYYNLVGGEKIDWLYTVTGYGEDLGWSW